MTSYPRFRFGEVVRVVVDTTDWAEGTPDVRGSEGVVSSFSPTESGLAWSIGVWLPDLKRVWAFDEDALESTGAVEVTSEGETDRVPLDPATHEESFGGEIVVRLFTVIEGADAARVAREAESALRSLIAVERITWKGEVHWDEPYRYDLDLEVHTASDSREAFEKLVASQPSGWTAKVDDGWSCHFSWSREADETDTAFLVPEAGDVMVDLLPWSDPSYRPVKRERTHDPGLPGFTPPPPPAGYE